MTDDVLVEDTAPPETLVERATKEIEESCGSCKKKSKKAYKITYDRQVAELKDKHKDDVTELRTKFMTKCQEFKAKTEKRPKRPREREGDDEAQREARERREGVDAGISEMKKKLEEKVKRLTHDFEKADGSRKEPEKQLKGER